jgi:hypothetical protein
MPSPGAASRAAVPISSARAEASRRNGAKSRGPKTPEGKARAAQNALKHGLRAEKYVVLPQEDAAAFRALEVALVAELSPDDALQRILVGRIAAAAWRLERAERLEAEVFEVRGYGGAGLGVTLIRDGNATRSIETLMRYRGAATAELMRSLRTLKTLQAEAAKRAADDDKPAPAAEPKRRRATAVIERAPEPSADRAAADAPRSDRAEPGRTASAPEPPATPNKPERRDRRPGAHVLPERPARTLHEATAPWQPEEPGRHKVGRGAPA